MPAARRQIPHKDWSSDCKRWTYHGFKGATRSRPSRALPRDQDFLDDLVIFIRNGELVTLLDGVIGDVEQGNAHPEDVGLGGLAKGPLQRFQGSVHALVNTYSKGFHSGALHI